MSAQEAGQMAKLPLLQHDAIKKREWVKKKTHGKANARGLTGAEIAGRELKAQDRAAKGINTLCPAGPFHLISPQAASLVSPTSSPSVLDLPASTAPTWLQEEQALGKRKRIFTQAYTGARHAGLPSLGSFQ
jgi:hypothetical protein